MHAHLGARIVDFAVIKNRLREPSSALAFFYNVSNGDGG
jgi:hypothetical protein